MKIVQIGLLASAALLMAGCATEEYRVAANECQAPALQTYPVVMQPHMFRRSREVMVPDGSTICETTEVNSKNKRGNVSQSQSVCRPGMLDMNAGNRDAYLSQCAKDLCLKRYGNLDCKVKK